MSDRLKFRVWDKYFERYWTDEQVKNNIQWLLYPDNENIENVIIEQCTGLRDKNGKLIFENDLILVNNIVYKVIYNKYKISLVNIKKNDIVDYDYNIICEVVGNEQEGYFGKI